MPIQSQYIPSFVSVIPTSYDGHKSALRFTTLVAPLELHLVDIHGCNVHARMTESMSGEFYLLGRVTFELSHDVPVVTDHPLG